MARTDMSIIKHMIVTAVFLGLFAVVGTAIVALTYIGTESQIAENERQALLKSLHVLIPSELHDNDIPNDTIHVTAENLLGSSKPVAVYRARKQGKAIAVVLAPTAPDGYNGDIKLLIAIATNGELMGVRVITHRETPGLGDSIEIARSDWIKGFDGKSLQNPGGLGWRVRKDGGDFDQFTGATITPRAIVKAVHKSLQYFNLNKQALLASNAIDVPNNISHNYKIHKDDNKQTSTQITDKHKEPKL